MKVVLPCIVVEKVKCSECNHPIMIDEKVNLVATKLWDERLFVEDVLCEGCYQMCMKALKLVM